MRKILEAIALAALTLSFWITWHALTGPYRLPGKIPTHFDAGGNPNGWGSSSTLLALPVVALLLYLIMTAASRLPMAFNSTGRISAEKSASIQILTLQMVTWIKTELVCLFAGLQGLIVNGARTGRAALPPLMMPMALVVIFGTVAWHFVAVFREARRP